LAPQRDRRFQTEGGSKSFIAFLLAAVVIGGGSAIVSLTSINLVAAGSAAAFILTNVAIGAVGVAIAITVVALAVYMVRAELKQKRTATQAEADRLKQVTQQLADFVERISELQEVVAAIGAYLITICSDCERLSKSGEGTGFEMQCQGNLMHKDCKGSKAFLELAIRETEQSLLNSESTSTTRELRKSKSWSICCLRPIVE
jgi:hypothetical protein